MSFVVGFLLLSSEIDNLHAAIFRLYIHDFEGFSRSDEDFLFVKWVEVIQTGGIGQGHVIPELPLGRSHQISNAK